MQTRSMSSGPNPRRPKTARPVVRRLIPGDVIKAEPRSDDDSDSEREKDEHGNLKGFVEYDKTLPHEKPADHKFVDQMWNSWNPTTPGGRRYKKILNKYK